jgi:hypothetical protein
LMNHMGLEYSGESDPGIIGEVIELVQEGGKSTPFGYIGSEPAWI